MKTYGDFVSKVFQKVRDKTQATEEIEWMDTLPRGDLLASLEIINRHLAALPRTETAQDENRINTLLSIDHGCRDIITGIENQYIAIQKLAPEIDRRMWDSMQSFHRYLAHGYQAYINDYSAHPNQAIQNEQHLPVIVIRALNCIYHIAKLRYFRYQTVMSDDWMRMHNLYRFAEREGFAGKPVAVYPESPECSFSERYVLALMMDTLNHSNMTKRQIDTIDGWLSRWVKGAAIVSNYDESRFLFYTNLDEGRGGRRIRNFKPTPSCRYWETDKLASLIGKARRFLKEGHSIEEFGLLESDRSQAWFEILDYLYSEWSRAEYRRQRRGEERNSVMRTADVVYGFQPVLDLVRSVGAGKTKESRYGLTLTLEEMASSRSAARNAPTVLFPEMTGERWTLYDESERGFGAIAGLEVTNSVVLGTLVALVCEDQRDKVIVGVVRSIKDMGNRRAHVGIEVFSRASTFMELTSTTAQGAAQRNTGDVFLDSTLLISPFAILQALYLPPDAALGTLASMIVPSLNYNPEGIFTRKIGDDVYTVRFGEIIEQKDDWIRAHVIVSTSPE